MHYHYPLCISKNDIKTVYKITISRRTGEQEKEEYSVLASYLEQGQHEDQPSSNKNKVKHKVLVIAPTD